MNRIIIRNENETKSETFLKRKSSNPQVFLGGFLWIKKLKRKGKISVNVYWKHFKTITKHKWVVFKLMAQAGYPIQGLKHDLSKYHPIEFYTSARYWSGTSSPIDKEKEAKGYSVAW